MKEEWIRLVRSFGHAMSGIIYTLKTQRNMQIHAVISGLVLIAGWILHLTWGRVLLVFFSIFLMFILEMVNTAIEATVDLVTREIHPLAKIAKDVAAGAVLLAALFSVIVGIYVFYEPLRQFIHNF
jgi:diacylglycerol kinase